MRLLTKIFLIIVIISSTIYSASSQTNSINLHILDPYYPEYVKGEVLVKFKDEVYIEAKVVEKAEGEIEVTTGLNSIDNFLIDYKTIEIEKVFKETRESSRAKSRDTTRYLTDFKGQRHKVPKLYNIYKLKFDEVYDAKELAELISKNAEVDYAEPNYFIYSMNTYPNDALYQSGEQWYIDAVNAPAAWDSVTCDTSQIIGIIDTGVDWDHPDLDGNIWKNWGEIPDNGLDDDGNGFIDDVRGWDFTSNSNDPDDDNGHGTHVAGVVAAETNNYVGISGIAWNARIMPIKVLTGTGSGNTAWLASAIYYAANNGATIINMSLGTYGESQAVKDALLFAYDTLTIVGAAGNDNLKVDTISPPNQAYGPMFPGCYHFVIGVEAATQTGTLAGFSNFDPSGFSETANPDGFNYEIIAPGVNIFSTFPGGGYRFLSGTSMASPIVAGAVALIKDFKPGISNEEIFARLIQFAQAGHLKIPNILHGTLGSDVFYVSQTLIDTVGNADNDGKADSDEAFDMWFTIKNAGGYADSVWAKLRLDYSGDTTLVSIIDSTSYIGNLDSAGFHNEIPAYTTLTGESDPFRVYIKPGVINEKDIVFKYEIGTKNGSSETGNFYLTIQNGEELKGILDSTFTLTPDKLWLINQSFKIIESGKLIIKPGTHLKIDKKFVIKGEIEGHGTKDSLIYIQGPEIFDGPNIISASFKHTKFYDFDQYFEGTLHFDHCIFEDFRSNFMFYSAGYSAFDCQFRELNVDAVFKYGGGNIIRCNFDNINSNEDHQYGGIFIQSPATAKFNNFINRYSPASARSSSNYSENNFVTSSNNEVYCAYINDPSIDTITHQYWGTTDTDKIDDMIWDFWEDARYPIMIYKPFLTSPSDSAHGMVWKILLNGTDPHDEYLDPIGFGKLRFDVYFNKCMDTSFIPMLTFGVRDPLTQHVVEDSASWSSDSTIWTAYYDVGAETGDGMNYIRVAYAVDTAGFKIPTENSMRFGFNIQAASSTSIQFLATPGIGKVYLDWPFNYTEDFLGYNMYRFTKIDSTTNSDTLVINSKLIQDSVFTDFDVLPDSTYYYCYKIVGTDLNECDYSKVISAIPLSTANGDANGDLSVTVLDITCIISYILEHDPQPFLFEAADVNYDGNINVLDLMLVVQIILNQKNVPLNYNDIIPEYIKLSPEVISLESKGQITAFQFEIFGDFTQSQRLFCNTEGLELVYSIYDNRIIGIMFSYINNPFPVGDLELIKFYPTAKSISWGQIIASNRIGNPVPLKTIKEPKLNFIQSELLCYPNPFSESIKIQFFAPSNSVYKFVVYNENGKVVLRKFGYQGLERDILILWNGISGTGEKLSAGIYFGSLEIVDFQTNKILSKKSKKLILMN